MKKNGFTIIELIVGVGLLSLVTIFMLAIIIDLRDTEQANGVDTKALIMQAIISKTLNNDVIRNAEVNMKVLSNELKRNKANDPSFDPNNYKEKAKVSIQLGDKSKFISLYNNSEVKGCPENSAQSFVYYSEKEGAGLDLSDTQDITSIIDKTNVELRKTLPSGYCFTDVEVQPMGITDAANNIYPNGQKLIISVMNANNQKMNFTIEAYYYHYKEPGTSG